MKLKDPRKEVQGGLWGGGSGAGSGQGEGQAGAAGSAAAGQESAASQEAKSGQTGSNQGQGSSETSGKSSKKQEGQEGKNKQEGQEGKQGKQEGKQGEGKPKTKRRHGGCIDCWGATKPYLHHKDPADVYLPCCQCGVPVPMNQFIYYSGTGCEEEHYERLNESRTGFVDE